MIPDGRLEFYETPQPFVAALVATMARRDTPIQGRIAEPCVGNYAIPRAANIQLSDWVTNDLDPHWEAHHHLDATKPTCWDALNPLGERRIDWTVTNPPFTAALDIAAAAISHSRVGVAMHLRASIHEVLKTGVRRIWMHRHPPTGIIWLPRFAYQRSKSKGTWTTDSVCACWCVWLTGEYAPGWRAKTAQFIEYADEATIDALDAFTPPYRERMDALMGFTGTEKERQDQCKARWKDEVVVDSRAAGEST